MIRAAFVCLALLTVVACTSAGVGSNSLSVVESRGGHSANPSATLGNRTPAGGATTAAAAGQWPVPKQTLTPGAVVTCTLPRPTSQRDVRVSEKRAVAQAYGYTGLWSAVEFDHRVPFALCGSNGRTNIWPEPIATAKRKDQLEDTVIRQVKAHTLTLTQGQAVFYGDWRTGYCKYVGGAPCQP